MKKSPWLLFVLLALFAVYYFTQTSTTSLERNDLSSSDLFTVHYIDAGQADATLFHLNDDGKEYVILYDAGDWKRTEVIDYLHDNGIKHIDVIIISHPHADHIGQLKPILEQFQVEEVWMSGNQIETDLYLSTMETVLSSDVTYSEPDVGDQFDIGPIKIEVLHPDSLTGDLNDDSLSIKVKYGDIDFLFTGDASVKTERLLMDRTNRLRAHFLQLGHHGSNTSSDLAFIRAVRPTYAIYSAGLNNKYGHPSPEVIQRFENEKIPILGTDTHGTIIVATDGEHFQISSEKEAKSTEAHTNNSEHAKVTEIAEEVQKSVNCIDLNHATKEELQEIVHIGEARAEAIITLRPIAGFEELQEIEGIGPQRLEEIITENKACITDE